MLPRPGVETAEPGRGPGEHPSRLDAFFQLTRHGTSIRTEFVAGLTMFFATGHLVAVVPALLARGGMPRAEGTTAVILVVGLATALGMGLYARRPFVVGPGIGGVALLGVTIVAMEGVPWQTAMGMAFLGGALFLVLTVAGLRSLIADAVPAPPKVAIAAGVGLFIAYLGFQNAGFVVASSAAHRLVMGMSRWERWPRRLGALPLRSLGGGLGYGALRGWGQGCRSS